MRSVPRITTGRRVAPVKREQGTTYGRRWRRLRWLVLAASPACEICSRPATEVHHVKPISDGGEPYDPTNLKALCRQCHDDQHGDGRRRG